MWAVEQKHPEAVKALLDGGADFRVRSGGAGNPRNYMSGTVGNNTAGAADSQAAALHCGQRRAFHRRATEDRRRSWHGRSRRRTLCSICPWRSRRVAVASHRRLRLRPMRPPAAARSSRRSRRLPPAGGQQAAVVAARAVGGRAEAARAATRGVRRDAAQLTTQPPLTPEPEDDGPVAGLVGSGGGGLTALVIAAREGDLESVKALVDAGADVNQTSNAGWTPLLIATNNRQLQSRKVPGRAWCRCQHRQQQVGVVPSLSRDRQPQHRRRRLSGSETGYGQLGVHQDSARSRSQCESAR